MKLKDLIWDKTLAIVFNVVGIIAAAVFAGMTAGAAAAIVIAAVWTAALIIYIAIAYFILKERIAHIRTVALKAEDKFLLSEILPAPARTEDRLYYELMLLQGRAAIDRVNRAEREKNEYYEYVQEWVHEVKLPITAITLICNHNSSDEIREIARQTGKIYNYTEQVLYETKSNNTEKDLMIRKTELAAVVNECVKDNKEYFIDSGMSIETDISGTVYTDEKWLGFILKQILLNCVQYSSNENKKIKIYSVTSVDKTELSVWDNGIGILESELPRIFDKSFTGSNGRRNKRSTGIGLYLCKKLCAALDVALSAESAVGKYTRISLVFNTSVRK